MSDETPSCEREEVPAWAVLDDDAEALPLPNKSNKRAN
jgi:hypothetical protein